MPSANPQAQASAQHGFEGLYPLYQQMQLDVLALSYSNAFLICTAITAGAIILAAMMRKPVMMSDPEPAPEPVAATAPPKPSPSPRPTGPVARTIERPADPEPVRLVKEPAGESFEPERVPAGGRRGGD